MIWFNELLATVDAASEIHEQVEATERVMGKMLDWLDSLEPEIVFVVETEENR